MDNNKNLNVKYFRQLPKSDLHNHCLLGGKRWLIERFMGRKLAVFRMNGDDISSLNNWIRDEFRPFIELPGAFEEAVAAAFIQARDDGIRRLEMSIDVCFGHIFGVTPERIIQTLKYCHKKILPEAEFYPELGFPRNQPVDYLLDQFETYIDYGYFRSIDLYDDEFAQPVENFRSIFQIARQLGMKCKAHAGEFGTPESVREAVEVLQLDAVQHGISAAGSPEIMRWLAGAQIPLNICPTSNIRMNLAKTYRTHPLRLLFDHGVVVTINTDDALVFGDGTSEQFMKLYKNNVFSLDELEVIRKNGLETTYGI
jgi:adenosine deaminase